MVDKGVKLIIILSLPTPMQFMGCPMFRTVLIFNFLHMTSLLFTLGNFSSGVGK